MAQKTSADGGTEHEHPAADLETVVVDADDVIETMRRNRRDADEQRSHVLRVTPPLEGERRAKPFVSETQNYYPPEMDPKPLHLGADSILVGHIEGSRHPDWGNEWNAPDYGAEHSLYQDEIPEDEQSDDVWDEWWATANDVWESAVRQRLKTVEEITLTSQYPEVESTTVKVRVEFDD